MTSNKKITLLAVLLFCNALIHAQTGVGIGIYPTGTETGLGFRLNKDKKISLDARMTRANMFSKPGSASFLGEVSAIYRIVFLEKVRFHMGLGFRTDWNRAGSKYGGVLPIGVEAFPFSFQNAGLFFEAAPFYVTDGDAAWHGGIRTVAGFVFYFPKKTAEKQP